MATLHLPDDFRFGVATAGFQVEGGYNGVGEPANNWADWERSGRVEPSGIALDFWNRAEEQLDRAVAAGCDAFRLSVEWARGEPAEGSIDDGALDRYAAILDACAERGLRPLVTLHHFTHPHWLGPDFWLRPESPDRFAQWAAVAAARLATGCRHWVTVNEPNIYALQTYLTGEFPPGRRFSVPSVVRSLDNLMAGHVLAYDAIHRVQPDAIVATNTYAFTVYEVDRLLVDVLLARAHGIARADIAPWLAERREAYYDALPLHLRALERMLRRVATSAIPLEKALPRTIGAVYDSPHRRALDVTQLDYYYPSVAGHFRPPGHRTAGGRNPLPYRMLWEDPPDPGGLTRFCRLDHEPGLDVWVVENGLCNRVRRGQSLPRLDGWDRVRYLREHLAAVVDAVDAGVPITGYYHWTLADNYEWGTFEPRFGLYGVDRERGNRWLDTDSMGGGAAAEYRRIADGLRAGDRSVVGR
ncbi:MAG: putative beta-glycosidase [Acidimicrobiales bacterium]|jgi:beta-glucosidase|nr:putative beta-glycosidase [Acidimicrobiales bacterium]